MAIDVITAESDGTDLRIGIVQARFNAKVCDLLREACVSALLEAGVSEEDVLVCTVPGALEIPSALAQLADLHEFDALIALGAVIKGDTYHFEVVCNQSAAGVAQVSLEYGIPVANAILTTYTDEQALARASEKGAEAARVAVEMANLTGIIGGITEAERDEQEEEQEAPVVSPGRKRT